MSIHPSAVVDPKARVAEDTNIGPFCVVGPEVEIGSECLLVSRVTIVGRTRVGRRNVFHPTSCVGGPPQDEKPPATDGRIEIGDDNLFREATTVHLPKMIGGSTRIGSGCRLDYGAHVAHDVEVGDRVRLGMLILLGGHACVEDDAVLEPQIPVHQFVTVGRRARIREHSVATEDVPPFMLAAGNHFEVVGVHRDGLAPDSISALEEAYRIVWKSGSPRAEAIAALEGIPSPEVLELSRFLRRSSEGRMGRARETLRRG